MSKAASDQLTDNTQLVKVISSGKAWKQYAGRTGSVYLDCSRLKQAVPIEPPEYWRIAPELGHPNSPGSYESIPVSEETGQWPMANLPTPFHESLLIDSQAGLLGARFAGQRGFFQNEKPRIKTDDIHAVFQSKGVIVAVPCKMSVSSVTGDMLVGSVDDEPTVSQILAALRSPDKQTQFEAVIDASHTKFTDGQRRELLDALHIFIESHLYTRVEEEITVVGSAVRKYALNMSESQFEDYATWLQPKQTEYPHHRVELELVKGICWRLAYEPVSTGVAFASLRSTLLAIGRNYTTDRFLLQKNYAAIALNSIVSVFILDAIKKQKASAKKLVSKLREAGLHWFGTMVARRLKTTVKDIGGHDKILAANLGALIASVSLLETNR